jgi:threonine dehydratase
LLSASLPIPKGARVCCVVSGGNVDLGRLKDLL